LYKRIPKIISKEKEKKAPATAKEFTSIPLCLIALSNKKETRPL
jgi:hypothetical protein